METVVVRQAGPNGSFYLGVKDCKPESNHVFKVQKAWAEEYITVLMSEFFHQTNSLDYVGQYILTKGKFVNLN